MSLVAISIVLFALILVISLVACGLLYFSYISISRDVADEDMYILIDNDETVVSSICKEIIQGGKWAKTLRKSSEPCTTTNHENIKPHHHENVVHNERELQLHNSRDDGDVLPSNLSSVVVLKNQVNDESSTPATTNNESVKLIPILEEVLSSSHDSFN